MDAESKIKLFKRVFNTPEGKEVLEELCADCHVFTGTYSNSPHSMAFKEGERSAIMRIIEACDVDLDYIRQLRKNIVDHSQNVDPRLKENQ